MSETNAEYQDILDEMIRIGKLKAEYKDIILEISELGSKACANGLIFGLGWGEDANHVVLNEYEIHDKDGNFLYLTFLEAREYLQNLIAEIEAD